MVLCLTDLNLFFDNNKKVNEVKFDRKLKETILREQS